MFAKFFVFFITLMATGLGWASPQIQHWMTDNKARVYFVAAPELPMVDVSVIFDAGSARDGKQPGKAGMTAVMIDLGTANMSDDDIATAFDNIGAQYSVHLERDLVAFGLRCLTQKQTLDKALDIYKEMLSGPAFPKAAFDHVQRILLTDIQAEDQSPQAISGRMFFEQLYGQHPYSLMPSGSADGIENLSPADLKAFYDRYYVSSNAVVVIVGAVSHDDAKRIADEITSDLAIGKPAERLPRVSPLTTSQLMSRSFPSTQTTILLGQVGISRDDPDYFPLVLGNHILGGSGLISQLNYELREKRGLTYGATSYFSPMRREGPYIFSVQTRNEKTQEALTVLQDTLKKFIQDGPSEEELRAAKDNITGSFALRVDSNSELSNQLGIIGFYGLPLDYLDTFNDKVNAISVADIKKSFERRVHPDKMLTVLVGGETAEKK